MGYIYPAMRLSALGRGLKMLAHQGARPGEEKTPGGRLPLEPMKLRGETSPASANRANDRLLPA